MCMVDIRTCTGSVCPIVVLVQVLCVQLLYLYRYYVSNCCTCTGTVCPAVLLELLSRFIWHPAIVIMPFCVTCVSI